MARVEQVVVPDIGDFDDVDVIEVLVAAGDQVAQEDPLITLESDKASMDVPSPLVGKVVDVSVKAGDKVSTGDVILTLEVDETAASTEPTESKRPTPMSVEDPSRETATERDTVAASPRGSVAPAPIPIDDATFTTAYASPAVRRIARELGVDLTRVHGSGRKGRILKRDVQTFVKKAIAEPPAQPGAPALPPMPVIDFSKFGPIEREPLSRIQKIARKNLHRSWLHVPHVTQHDEADITEMEAFRREHSEEAKAKGFKFTPVVFIMKAAVAALQKYPRVNSSLDPDGEHVILKKYYHLGIAVDTEHGLMVPVIRDVDGKGMFDLARELAEVSAQAREGKLRPDQIQGASFTITSLGGIGGTAFTPIINAPEVAILGVSRSQMRQIWDGEKFVPRLILPLSLSYDHRVVDGVLAVRFTTYLCSLFSDLRILVL